MNPNNLSEPGVACNQPICQLIIIINDSMTSVLNTNASLPCNHDLFESLIVKKRIKILVSGPQASPADNSCWDSAFFTYRCMLCLRKDIQGPPSIVRLKLLRTSLDDPHFTLGVSSEPDAMVRGICGVGVALSPKVENVLLDWIPANSGPYAAQLILMLMRSETEKDEFYQYMSRLLLQDYVGSDQCLMLAGQPVDVVDKFVCAVV
ncbi:hypothetical protein T265_06679 [Opisthorchis viverrini]|uniref:Uncharacterized protein n=1 Tax=Opisthorchis viverrini TaxID=6198 RepID=A0A074ZFC5_OPIVI|nr:hypothetical protein T265_06679 [Opisthorchis viverrini]KER25986.1 hypothetical protein T265_06679 [Opisthorchis viverrini]